MKTTLIATLLFMSLLIGPASFAQQGASTTTVARITFMLKNTLGYHRMFRVEGPGIAYGFTMNKRETIPCTWPIGSKLYFSRDGETNNGLILTITGTDEGKTLGTDTGATETKSAAQAHRQPKNTITIRLQNPSLMPKKVALISYEPGEPGNSTNIFTLAPLAGSRAFKFPVGTKLYLANNEQVGVVMSGKRIDSDKPFLIVKAGDAGKAFDLK